MQCCNATDQQALGNVQLNTGQPNTVFPKQNFRNITFSIGNFRPQSGFFLVMTKPPPPPNLESCTRPPASHLGKEFRVCSYLALPPTLLKCCRKNINRARAKASLATYNSRGNFGQSLPCCEC